MHLLRVILLLALSGHVFAQDDPAPVVQDAIEDTEPAADSTASDAPSESSEPTPEVAERVLPIPATRRIIETVKHLGLYQREGEVIKFSDDESSISGLYLPENTGKPQGGILILHDIAQHAHWPHTVAPLREYLPDYGWNTLSLFFSDYLNPPLPDISTQDATEDVSTTEGTQSDDPETTQAEDVETNLAEGAEELAETDPLSDENIDTEEGTDALDEVADNFEAFPVPDSFEADSIDEDNQIAPDIAFLELMQERVEGGLQQLNTLGQFNLVIIAHGLSANWAVETLRARFSENPNVIGYSLILIDAKQSSYPAYKLNEELGKLSIPVLDLYTKSSEDMKSELLSRKNSVVRQQKADYIQIGLPSLKTIHSSKHNMISRRVRGWLKTHAAGEEVTVKERRG